MSVINEVVKAVIDWVNDDLYPFEPMTRGALPTGNGLTCEVAPSAPEAVFLDKNTYVPLDLTINGKHHNLQALTDTLNDIHAVLTRAKIYPSGEYWEIVDITNYTLPQIIGREGNNVWLMASSLSVKVYIKGDDSE